MKTLIIILLISFGFNAYTQNSVYVRVYNLAGKKIYKGKVYTITDSSLFLIGKKDPVRISVSSIGPIRTKRSAGNNVLTGAVIGMSIGALVGAVSADPDAEIMPISTGEGAAAGAILFAPIGAAVGGITGLLKKKETFLINGDYSKWATFKSFVLE